MIRLTLRRDLECPAQPRRKRSTAQGRSFDQVNRADDRTELSVLSSHRARSTSATSADGGDASYELSAAVRN